MREREREREHVMRERELSRNDFYRISVASEINTSDSSKSLVDLFQENAVLIPHVYLFFHSCLLSAVAMTTIFWQIQS